MWVISGPFDGQESGEVGFQKEKLLKAGAKYMLGRKQRPLLVNHKKVSHDHAEFTVGVSTHDDVKNPSSIPKLEVVNSKTKTLKLFRGSKTLVINPQASQELHDGDTLEIVAGPGITLSVRWVRLCFYSRASREHPQFNLDACAQLGINIVDTLDSEVTHHLLDAFSPSCGIAHSLLLATQFVRPDWLNEIIRMGNLPIEGDSHGGISLESLFALPPIAKYRPSLPLSLPPALKVFKVWEPNEERLNMFTGHRFIFVGEKGREIDPPVREMIIAGGGEYEGFTVSGGRSKLHQVLAKGMRRITEMAGLGKALIVVADEGLMKTAIGFEFWKDLVDEIRSFQLRHISVDDIVQAVITLDLSCFAPHDVEELQPSSIPPDCAPNTFPDEPTIPPETQSMSPVIGLSRKRKGPHSTPRSLPRQATPEALNEHEKAAEPSDVPVRKGLTRRAKAGKSVIIGIDDPSTIIDAEREDLRLLPSVDETVNSLAISDSHMPAPRSSRLKRRAGTAALATAPQLSFNIEESVGEPPLKKYRALFEASDPDRIANNGPGNHDKNRSDTQTTSLTKSDAANPTSTVMASVGSQMTVSSSDQNLTRRKVTNEDPDTQSPSTETFSGSVTKLGTRKRGAEDSNGISSPTGNPLPSLMSRPDSGPVTKKVKLDTAASGPDRDEAFLKALASTRKGKKLEDSFDREFNNLKISKPELVREEPQEEWSLLADFDNERDIRGNFMVIVEMDVHKNQDDSALERVDARPEWQLRDNFKKFKKKILTHTRTTIQLVAREEGDYGTGSSYWKEANSQSQNSTFPSLGTSQVAASSRREPRSNSTSQKEKQIAAVDHPPTIEAIITTKSSQPNSRRQPSNSGTVKKASRAAEQPVPQSLFLESDQEDESQDRIYKDQVRDEALTLQSSDVASTRPRTVRKAKGKAAVAAIVVDDDSDDGATFKGFQRKRGNRV